VVVRFATLAERLDRVLEPRLHVDVVGLVDELLRVPERDGGPVRQLAGPVEGDLSSALGVSIDDRRGDTQFLGLRPGDAATGEDQVLRDLFADEAGKHVRAAVPGDSPTFTYDWLSSASARTTRMSQPSARSIPAPIA